MDQPNDVAPAAAPGVFLSVDSTRVSHREYWWGARNPLVILGWMTKWLRIRLPSSTDDPSVETLSPFEVEALPEDVQASFGPIAQELSQLGYHSPVFHFIDDRAHSTRTCLASFVHASGRSIARIHMRCWYALHPPRVRTFSEFLTPFADGGWLWSLSSKPDLAAPASMRVVRKVGAPAGELHALHEQALMEDRARRIAAVGDAETLRDAVESHHAAVRDYHLGRGIFRPLTEDDRRHAARIEERQQAAAAGVIEHPEVLAELERIQTRRRGWNPLIILGISILLFVGVGQATWGWTELLLLIPILFFHEMGHFVAMKLFGYQDLRMFFIPFFGAAVAGKNYNAPGWKKVIVSLMGPLPGIVLGIGTGIVFLFTHHPILEKASLLLLLVNAFNLLPILPLDGGWVMHTLLFSRHHLLDSAFRGMAAAALLLAGFWLGDRPLLIIGAFMILGLPLAYKLARITAALRREMPPAPPGAFSPALIPVDRAQAIIARLKSAFPKGLSNRAIAQHTLRIYETVNARPPGVSATLGFLSLYAGGFIAALVFGVVMFLVPALQARRAVATGLPKLTHRVLATTRPAPRDDLFGTQPRLTFIITCPNHQAALDAQVKYRRDPLPGADDSLFGDTLFVRLSNSDQAGRDRLYQRLVSEGGLHVAYEIAIPGAATRPSRNNPGRASFHMECQAPDLAAAQRLQEQISQYLHPPSEFLLIPPWTRQDPRTSAQRHAHDRARATYLRLSRAGYDATETDPVYRELQQKFRAALRSKKGDVSQIMAQQHQRFLELQEAEYQAIRKAGPALYDQQLVGRFLAQRRATTRPSDWEAALRLETEQLAPLMGRITHDWFDNPLWSEQRFAARSGSVRRDGLTLRLSYVCFYSSPDAAPAIVEWLSDQGCSDFRYDFVPLGRDDDEDP